jgi:hypothetical protein
MPAVYSQNVMCEGTVRQWCRMFKDGRTNVHDEERSSRPSAVSYDLVQSVGQKICEKQRFTISELLCEFPQISCTALYKIITAKLDYHQFCARWVLKMLMGTQKMLRMASALMLLERYHKDGNEFLNLIVTGDEICVSFVIVETKELSKQ